MDSTEPKNEQPKVEPYVSSAALGWLTFLLLVAAILVAAYFLKP